MKNLTLSLLLLFVFGIYAIAQDSSDQTTKGPSSETAVQGCLSHSGAGYTLTDKSGTAFHLTGETSKLTEHVGHEVEIRGKMATAGEAQGASSAATGSEIDVSSVKHIAATCTSSSPTGKEKSPTDEKPPMTEKPPMSEQPPIPH
ncbi:MAG: hypothetical protein ACM3JB_24220 [Acidobacteriaceae bacterium]